ncbi:MAG: amino acid ABC transporter permease [Oscillospiraceae bacterium]|jgi:His/Glu/Gln/Arg/opine family amino acid ABC transporter permease subunit|nr:amino acid ABC transporter permease [Oscillospiraceae bacterium]
MIQFEKIYTIFVSKFPSLVNGVVVTLRLAMWTVLFGTVLGIIIAVLRRMKFAPIRWVVSAYVAFIRGTPLLVQVLLFVYGLPQLGVRLPRELISIFALVFNSGAYMAEIIRAGIQAIDRGQNEAAESLGMTRVKTMIYIILPQAVKTTLPAMGNEFIVIIKESSILYAVGIYELTYQANKIASTNYLYIETMLVAALIYFVLTYVCSKLLSLLERWMRRSER